MFAVAALQSVSKVPSSITSIGLENSLLFSSHCTTCPQYRYFRRTCWHFPNETDLSKSSLFLALILLQLICHLYCQRCLVCFSEHEKGTQRKPTGLSLLLPTQFKGEKKALFFSLVSKIMGERYSSSLTLSINLFLIVELILKRYFGRSLLYWLVLSDDNIKFNAILLFFTRLLCASPSPPALRLCVFALTGLWIQLNKW